MDFASFFKQYLETIGLLYSISWWWAGPIVLFWLFKLLWNKYVRGKYAASLPYVILEIKPPRDVERSPRTMEQIFASIHGVWSNPNLIDHYIGGRQFQTQISFEILGKDGKMHFYVRCDKYQRNFMESLIYSQYPDTEITEAEDYAKNVPFNIPNNEWDVWGSDYKLAKADAYPIRTYKHFQEDVTKEMIDPLSPMAETIASLPPGHQIWFQMVITPIKDDEWSGAVNKVARKLAKKEEEQIPFLILSFFSGIWEILSSSFLYIFHTVEEIEEKKKDEQPLMFRLTPGEQETLKAVEESLNKKACLVKMRLLYVYHKKLYNKTYWNGIDGAFAQMSDPNLNSLVADSRTKTFANYIFIKPREYWAKRKIFNRYLDRDMDGPTFVLNSEELATIYHMPDMSVMSPSIARVEAKKGSAPSNLPIK